MKPRWLRSTEGLAVGGVGRYRPVCAVGRTAVVPRRRTARIGRRRERQAELARPGLGRRLHRLAVGRRPPLPGHVVRVSHACLLPQPRTARANRRQDAAGAVTVTALLTRLARWTASGHSRPLSGERRPPQDSRRVVDSAVRLSRGRPGAPVVPPRVDSVRDRWRLLVPCRDGMRTARRTHRPLWTGRGRRQRGRHVRPVRRLGSRSIRRRPRRPAACGVHSGLLRLVPLEVGQPLVVGQLPLARLRVVR
jgi:hypothetical protein